MTDSCEKPIFIFDCNDARTFFVSTSGGQDQLVESASVLTLSASDTISPVLCAGKVFKFDEVAKDVNDLVAYVSVNGNDATAKIGDISFPYKTLQTAYNAGANMYEIGLGTFTGLTALTGQARLKMRGSGSLSNNPIKRTFISDIKNSGKPENIIIEDVGNHSIYFSRIGESTPLSSKNSFQILLHKVTVGEIDATNIDGKPGASVHLYDSHATTIRTNGGDALTANAGDGGEIYAVRSDITFIYAGGGNGTGIYDGGNGGAITLDRCSIYAMNTDGGNSVSGTAGNSGIVVLDNCKDAAIIDASGGDSTYSIGGIGDLMTINDSNLNAVVITHNGGDTTSNGIVNELISISHSIIGDITSDGSNSTTVGASGGPITLTNSTVSNVFSRGGGVALGGSAGDGGVVTTYNVTVPITVDVSSGDYASDINGNGGYIIAYNSFIGEDAYLRGGSSGSGGVISASNSFFKGTIDMSASAHGDFFPLHSTHAHIVNGTIHTEMSDLGEITIFEDFMGTSNATGNIGELGWGVGGGATYTRRGSELNHPGVYRMERAASGVGYLHLTYLSGQGIAGYSGTTLETVIRINSLSDNSVDFGLAGVGTLTTSGRKGWNYDPSISPNWRLIHVNSSGTVTATDSGIPATTGWQILTLSFNGDTTTGTVKTSSGSITVANSGSATTSSSDHAINYALSVTSGTQSIDIDCFRVTSKTILDRTA